jgi:heterodisulfide reductase subunit C
MKSLSRIIHASTGQDISRCQGCFDCDLDIPIERDISLGLLIQLALMDDEEALLSRTLWSDSALQASRGACKRGINLHAVMMVLREEAKKRNFFR